MKYSTLIFDAFDTVVHINESKLPTCPVDGKNVPTTAHAVHTAYNRLFPELDFDIFYGAFSQSFTQVNRRRRADLREIPSQERFRLMLELLGHSTAEITDDRTAKITRAHMMQLQEAFEVRPDTMKILEWAKTRYRVAMISNFGYAPTLYDTLERAGIRSIFETIIVSVEAGWCKPHRMIFDQTFERMGIGPRDALFIGDQLYVDVYGALNSGMDVAWIETERQDWLPPEVKLPLCKPTYTVKTVTELIPILEKN